MRSGSGVKSLGSIQDLARIIEADALEESRYPTRFILVDGIASWRGILELLKARADKVVNLSAYCKETDTLPRFSLSDLIPMLEEGENRKISIVPIAELLRIREEKTAEAVVSLAVRENVGHRRIYVPLFQCSEAFHRAMERISRWHAGELFPVWKVGTAPDHFTVTIAPLLLRINDDSLQINGVKEYLRSWEKGQAGGQPIYIRSNLAKGSEDVHGSVSVKVYKSGYEALVGSLQESMLFERAWGTESHWEWLASEVTAVGEQFGSIAGRILNLAKYDFWQGIGALNSLEEKKTWLFWLWTKIERPDNYAARAIEKTGLVADIEEVMANYVLTKECERTDLALNDRKRVLEVLGVTELPKSFWTRFDQLGDPLSRLQVLTGLTPREKEETIIATKELLEDGRELSELLPYLDRAHSGLALYLTPLSSNEGELLRDYLMAFNISRVMNTRTPELDELTETVQQNDTLFQVQLRDKLLEDARTDSVYEVWIDGLGVQWLGLVKEYLRRFCQRVEAQVLVARANLPSITGANRTWPPNAKLIRDLDRAGHSYDHKYPYSLAREIDIVEDSVKQAIDSLRQCSQVLITSDHGATPYGFVKGSNVPIPEHGKVHKWGRCAEVPTITPEIASGREWVEENGWICLRGHNRFEEGGGTGEDNLVHGGATLEEALVPVITIWKKKAVSAEGIRVTVLDPKARLDPAGIAMLRNVRVSPDPGDLSLRTRGNMVFTGLRQEEGTYDFRISHLKPGTHQVWFESQSRTIDVTTIQVVGAGMEEKDIGI